MYNLNNLLVSLVGYFFIFLLPVYCYLKFKDKINPFSYLKLNNRPLKGIVTGLLFSLIYLLCLMLRNYILGWRTINLGIGIQWISVLLVGILEEVPFRGFILQKLQNRTSFWIANIITSLLFTLVHYPTWIITGVDLLQSSMSILLVSLVFGYIFKEFDSLWVPIICHSIFNMSTWIGLK